MGQISSITGRVKNKLSRNSLKIRKVKVVCPSPFYFSVTGNITRFSYVVIDYNYYNEILPVSYQNFEPMGTFPTMKFMHISKDEAALSFAATPPLFPCTSHQERNSQPDKQRRIGVLHEIPGTQCIYLE